MKDYEKLYRACTILDKYNSRPSEFNLNPEHDAIYLCFWVLPSDLPEEELKELEELGCFHTQGNWQMFISC